jgi:hypothetical protein
MKINKILIIVVCEILSIAIGIPFIIKFGISGTLFCLFVGLIVGLVGGLFVADE